MSNFYIYVKKSPEGEITFMKKVKISTKDILETESNYGYSFILHKSKEQDLKKFIFVETMSGCSVASGDTIEEVKQKFKDFFEKMTKSKFLLELSKKKKIIKELEEKYGK